MSARSDIQKIEKAVSEAAAKHDIKRVYLFGSYARGEASANSDVDLCIDAGSQFSLFSAGTFLNSVQTALGIDIDIVSEESMYPFAKQGMLADRVLIYERL